MCYIAYTELNKRTKTGQIAMEYKSEVAQWAFNLLKTNSDRLSVVYFRKRTTKEMRRMACIYSTATDQGTRAKSNLLLVWDIEKGEPRHISMDAVQMIVIDGVQFDFASYKKAQEDMRDEEMIREQERYLDERFYLDMPLHVYYVN